MQEVAVSFVDISGVVAHHCRTPKMNTCKQRFCTQAFRSMHYNITTRHIILGR